MAFKEWVTDENLLIGLEDGLGPEELQLGRHDVHKRGNLLATNSIRTNLTKQCKRIFGQYIDLKTIPQPGHRGKPECFTVNIADDHLVGMCWSGGNEFVVRKVRNLSSDDANRPQLDNGAVHIEIASTVGTALAHRWTEDQIFTLVNQEVQGEKRFIQILDFC